MDYGTPGFSVLHSFLEFAQTHVHWVGDAIYLIFCCPLLLLPSIFLSIKGFSNDSGFCIRWPKYWSFSINSFNEYSGIISSRIDWFILLAIQGALKSLLQHHTLKASLLLSIFMVQLSPYLLRVYLNKWIKVPSLFLAQESYLMSHTDYSLGTWVMVSKSSVPQP